MTADAKCLVFIKGPYHESVYVGELKGPRTLLDNPRLLTLDNADNLVTVWTRDSRGVYFHTDRNGKWQIFFQRIDQRSGELLISDQRDDKGARLTPDGHSIIYSARPKYKFWKWAAPTNLMITSVSGGPDRVILSERSFYSVRCARAPASLCVIGEAGLKDHRVTFYALDFVHGKGPELAKTDIDLRPQDANWGLSPDGSRIAETLGGEPDGRIVILSLVGGQAQEITVKGRSGFQSMDWSADGRGLYISSRNAWGADLLYVDLHGRATVLRRQSGSYYTWAVPSPDGKHLAFLEWTAAGNIWMMKGF